MTSTPIAQELTMQMGRPRCSDGAGERWADGCLRGRTMIDLAPEGVGQHRSGCAGRVHTVHPAAKPLGVVFVVAPWNYPWLTAVNALVPSARRWEHGGTQALRSRRRWSRSGSGCAAKEAGLAGWRASGSLSQIMQESRM